MKRRLSAVLLAVMLVLSSVAYGQDAIIDQDHDAEVITVDQAEITLDLHHIGQKTGQ